MNETTLESIMQCSKEVWCSDVTPQDWEKVLNER